MQILLIEDDPDYARLAREYLKDARLCPHQLHVVTTLSAAVAAIQHAPPDVIVADLGLPDATGDEVVPALRSAGPRVPIVVLSGHDDIDRALASMQQGAQEFLVKGRSDDFFLARAIRAAIERKRVEEFEQLLVGVVSHDLRGPLQTLCSVIELLESESGASELIALARSALARAISLTNDLLDFTKLRIHGLLPITVQSAELSTCVRSVIDELRLTRPDRTITLDLQGDTHGEFDFARMTQVVSNLIDNALQHSPEEMPVVVRCRGTPDELVFEVANRGDPIASDMLSKLFRPLERLHSKRGKPGSVGLGLYIANQIVRAHCGAITVTSTREEGTSFRVTLPRDHVRAGAPSLTTAARAPLSPRAS